MKITKIAAATATLVTAAGLVVGAAGAANAAAAPSDAPVHLFSNDGDGGFVAKTATIQWADDISLSMNGTDPYAPFTCSADATAAATFWADLGNERTPANYRAWAPIPLIGGKVAGPDITPQLQERGTTAPIKANGGDYSVGVACTKDNGINLAASGVWFFTAHVTAGTGAYTFETGASNPTNPDTGTKTGDIALEATTIAQGVDGNLSLVVPAGAKATLGAASLVNGLSTSTGTLPAFTVDDQRVVSKPGWNLIASTTNFVNGADASKTIDAKQLGVKPTIATNPGGVVAGTEHVAGDATAFSGFASAPAGTGTGATSLSADLKLVAPSGTPAGTYASTMTLTLVSK
ncbi:hypothetical protein [Leifsonia aquatica]|uniref:hypothetical protein n=1 Tax=Leifsonia aquatica TaxID=144185 RepID=UPI0004685755|nr:hypothetical protein [Leifsonia aquatica]